MKGIEYWRRRALAAERDRDDASALNGEMADRVVALKRRIEELESTRAQLHEVIVKLRQSAEEGWRVAADLEANS